MSNWRKKPVVIEAVQFDPLFMHCYELPEGVHGIPAYGADNWSYAGCEFYIDTLEGRMTAKAGDWIIKGVKGEFYPCKPDIFEMTYEPADAPTDAVQVATLREALEKIRDYRYCNAQKAIHMVRMIAAAALAAVKTDESAKEGK